MLRSTLLVLATLLVPSALAATDGTGGPDGLERDLGAGCFGPTATEQAYCGLRRAAFVFVHGSPDTAALIVGIVGDAILADVASGETYVAAVQGSVARGDVEGAAAMTLSWGDGRCTHWVRATVCHGEILA